MALAVTHVLVVIFVLDIFRHYVFGVKKFPRYLLVVGGIAGLLPDIDIPLGWIAGSDLHGLFTHSLIFVLIFLFFGLISVYQKEIERAKWFWAITAGWLIHILLDCGFNAYSTFLWPLPIDTLAFCPESFLGPYYGASIDAVILVAWLVHEEAHKKIKDYF
ncbi:MAG TPA: metal-dependent hydrolase [Candidatus Nanoarchaeia archaeon]|nr:metal-dependent hydrolase [Candidatus Nanoarchaeia archaeon]